MMPWSRAIDEASDELGEPLVVLVQDLVLEADVVAQLGELGVLEEGVGMHLLQALAQRGDVLPVGDLLLHDARDHGLEVVLVLGEVGPPMYRTNRLVGVRHRRRRARAARRCSSKRR